MRRAALAVLCGLGLVASTLAGQAQPGRISDEDVVDAYQYFLSRLLVLRQEHRDFQNGFEWNKLVHRKPGGVDWANPDPDVAYSEAWIAVDGATCTVVELPKIKGRYYTVQALNGWGETVANINDRIYPNQKSGRFALCRRTAAIPLSPDVTRVDVPGDKSRVLVRIELGADPQEALRLQGQLKMQSMGSPKIQPTVASPDFPNHMLPGVESFDNAEIILRSDPDINPGMDRLQEKVRAVAAAAADARHRPRIDTVIRTEAIPRFFAAFRKSGLHQNGWRRPTAVGNYGSDFLGRSLGNFASMWANNNGEVIYYSTSVDGAGQPLDGSNAYTMTFPPGIPPASLAKYFWSVAAVDPVKFQVIGNPRNRHLVNEQSGVRLSADGSLTLVFANEQPQGVAPENWLPTPAGLNYHLTFRFYGPREQLASGAYFPPPLVRQDLQEGRAVKQGE